MKFLQSNIQQARDHLALDESMLMAAEQLHAGESLRVWEFSEQVVVAGRSSRVEEEIDTEFCQQSGIEILRRCSGGASVVGGPGCLMYSVVLSLVKHPSLRKIDHAHQFVMSRVLKSLQEQIPQVELQGICDVVWNDRKCSGNSLRVHRNHLLYHGTLLYGFNLDFLHRCLKFAPRQPEYRRGRDHSDFVTNIPVDPKDFNESIRRQFDAEEKADKRIYEEIMATIRSDRYEDEAWHYRH